MVCALKAEHSFDQKKRIASPGWSYPPRLHFQCLVAQLKPLKDRSRSGREEETKLTFLPKKRFIPSIGRVGNWEGGQPNFGEGREWFLDTQGGKQVLPF